MRALKDQMAEMEAEIHRLHGDPTMWRRRLQLRRRLRRMKREAHQKGIEGRKLSASDLRGGVGEGRTSAG